MTPVPKIFRSSPALRVLAVLALGSSLAATAGSVLGKILGTNIGRASSISTLVFGLLWAIALRNRATIGKSTFRLGWLASIPLAMANSALTFALAGMDHISGIGDIAGGFVVGILFGGVFGAVVWVPALIVTLICFGLPIMSSHTLADAGLAGEERGEAVVGIACAIITVCAALFLLAWDYDEANAVISMVAAVLAFVGVTTGVLAAVLAARRGRARNAFVREVEAGKIANFRIDTTATRRILVRVTRANEGYRVTDFEEPIATLDA
ncbi:MAG: hypothetical protein FWD69_18025 [Polyangiaceae bacterium]|nr:hypothetical protein [Polyangiaceae bacterium]